MMGFAEKEENAHMIIALMINLILIIEYLEWEFRTANP